MRRLKMEALHRCKTSFICLFLIILLLVAITECILIITLSLLPSQSFSILVSFAVVRCDLCITSVCSYLVLKLRSLDVVDFAG